MLRTTTADDGSEIAILTIEEAPMQVEIMGPRLRCHPLRPAVQAFATLLREAFGPGGFLEHGSGTDSLPTPARYRA